MYAIVFLGGLSLGVLLGVVIFSLLMVAKQSYNSHPDIPIFRLYHINNDDMSNRFN